MSNADAEAEKQYKKAESVTKERVLYVSQKGEKGTLHTVGGREGWEEFVISKLERGGRGERVYEKVVGVHYGPIYLVEMILIPGMVSHVGYYYTLGGWLNVGCFLVGICVSS